MAAAMNIDPKSFVAGVPIREVRDFLRKHADHVWHPDALRETFADRADRLLAVLLSEGYVEQVEEHGTFGYGNTPKGGQLARASAARPVTRSAAQRALDEFVARCEEVRQKADFLYTVETAILFGSMLGSKPTVSDVDLAIKLRRKEKDHARHVVLMQEQSRQAVREGRRFSNIVEQVGYAEMRVWRFLKGRSRIIQLTSADDPILEQAETRIIFADPE